jgi:hypothetical protein
MGEGRYENSFIITAREHVFYGDDFGNNHFG